MGNIVLVIFLVVAAAAFVHGVIQTMNDHNF